MEPLSAIISLLRPRVVHPKLITGSGRWGVRYPKVEVAGYGLVLSGGCHLIRQGMPPAILAAGDFVLMPPSPGFVMASDPDVEPVMVDAGTADGLTEVRHGDQEGTAEFEMLGGYFLFDPANISLLAELLPDLVHVRGADVTAKRLAAMIDLATEEALARRPGRDLILERLVEVMLVEALRHSGESAHPVGRPNLLRGLADPNLSRALRCFHADLQRHWTVGELAREAGLSRSAFSERFAAAVGLPPMAYLIQWRMAVAKDLLRRGGMPLEELAFAIGYESASAFSTAFRKNVGRPPSQFAKEMRADARPTAEGRITASA